MNLVLEVEGLTGLNFGEFNLSDANTIDEFYGKAEGTARAQRVIHRGRSQGSGRMKLYPGASSALSGLVADGQTLAVGGFGLCGIPRH